MIKDLLVPLAVLASIASIIIPLPPALLDVLIISNLMLALILLISALNISEPTKFSALPTLLLLATLYRLALNVSTTRLILSRGEAGKTIETFGSLVIQGNLIVGFVVFLLISIVQFIVIAKGAERVAEVAARFTLDALPGKQMSIDAELRAGMIDFHSAKQRRQDLQIESRFYGALDGAMKFVKGDAIAGMLIIAVNVLGGLAVGVLIEGLEIGRALHRYTTLSVGDGLVTQIPALLNALAAGVVVTRVSRGDQRSLSSDLIGQLSQYRIVTGLAGVVALGMSCVPGLPIIPLVLVAAFLGVITCLKRSNPEVLPKSNPVKAFEANNPACLIVRATGDEAFGLQLREQWELLRADFFDRLGLLIPPAVFEVTNSSSNEPVTLLLRGYHIYSDKPGAPAAEAIGRCGMVLEQHAVELIDDAHTRRLLHACEKQAPELVQAVVPQTVGIIQLTEITRRLVEEQIPLKNFDLALQAVAEFTGKTVNERQLLEEVRMSVRRSISAQLTKGQAALFLEPVSDYLLVQRERAGRGLEFSELIDLGRQVREKLSGLASDIDVVVVASKGARRLLRDSLWMQDIKRQVVAFEETQGLCQLQEAGRLQLECADRPEKLIEQAEAA